MAAKFTVQLVGDASSATKALGDVGKAGDNLDGKTSGWSSRWSSAFGNMGGILARFSSDGSSNAGGLLGSLNGLNSGGASALGALGGAAGVAAASFATALAGMASKAWEVSQEIGQYLYDLGDQYNTAFNTIRVGVGDNMELNADLKESYKDVYEQTTASSGEVATVLTTLHQKLGSTGDPLEELSLGMLRFSKLTGTDLKSNMEKIPRLFGDWSVAAEDQIGTMDKLFRLWQDTGVPLDQLQENMTKFGGPLRQLGFSFDESAAMVAKFQSKGVNTELVMGSMRVSLGRMARAGEDPIATFRRVTEEIKNAGSSGEANSKALELFGAKAGPDMAAAIREGRFEIDDLLGTITGGSDTLKNAATDTATWRGQWTKFTHYAENTLEPAATAVFGVINDGLSGGITMVKGWVDAFKDGGIDGLFDQMGTDFDTVKANFKTLLANAKKWWEEHGDEVIDGLKEGFKKGMEKLGEGASWLLDKLGEWLPKIGDWIMNTGVPWLEDHWGEWWKTATDWFGKMAPIVIEKLGGLLASLTEWFVGTALPWAFKTGWDWMSSLFKWLLTDGIPTLIGALGTLLGAVWEWIETDGVSAMADAGRNLWGALGEGAAGVFNWIIEKWNALDFAVDIKLPDFLGGGEWKDDDIIPDIPLIDTRSAYEKSTGGAAPKYMASGGEFTARRPTLMMVGDLGQHERVSVRPAGSDGGSIENAGRPLQVQIVMDSKVVADKIYPHIIVKEGR